MASTCMNSLDRQPYNNYDNDKKNRIIILQRLHRIRDYSNNSDDNPYT